MPLTEVIKENKMGISEIEALLAQLSTKVNEFKAQVNEPHVTDTIDTSKLYDHPLLGYQTLLLDVIRNVNMSAFCYSHDLKFTDIMLAWLIEQALKREMRINIVTDNFSRLRWLVQSGCYLLNQANISYRTPKQFKNSNAPVNDAIVFTNYSEIKFYCHNTVMPTVAEDKSIPPAYVTIPQKVKEYKVGDIVWFDNCAFYSNKEWPRPLMMQNNNTTSQKVIYSSHAGSTGSYFYNIVTGKDFVPSILVLPHSVDMSLSTPGWVQNTLSKTGYLKFQQQYLCQWLNEIHTESKDKNKVSDEEVVNMTQIMTALYNLDSIENPEDLPNIDEITKLMTDVTEPSAHYDMNQPNAVEMKQMKQLLKNLDSILEEETSPYEEAMEEILKIVDYDKLIEQYGSATADKVIDGLIEARLNPPQKTLHPDTQIMKETIEAIEAIEESIDESEEEVKGDDIQTEVLNTQVILDAPGTNEAELVEALENLEEQEKLQALRTKLNTIFTPEEVKLLTTEYHQYNKEHPEIYPVLDGKNVFYVDIDIPLDKVNDAIDKAREAFKGEE